MNKEIWKPVQGYEGLYEVSDLGNVRSLNYRGNGETRLLRPTYNGYGYLKVDFCKNHKKKTHLVHRLVAQTFLNNPNDYSEIDHINSVRDDNQVENLRFCTHQMNRGYARHTVQRVIDKINTIPNYGDLLVLDESMPVKYDKRGQALYWVKFINPTRKDHIDGFKKLSNIKRALKRALTHQSTF